MARAGIELSWAELKTIQQSIGGSFRYVDQTENYLIWLVDQGVLVSCEIPKTSPAGTDQSDFETNFKDDANSKAGRQRLRVFEQTTNINVSAGSSHTIFDSATENIDSGTLKFLQVMFDDNEFDVEVIADGTQCYRLATEDLKDEHEFLEGGGGSSSGGDYGINGVPFTDSHERKFTHIADITDFASTLVIKVHNNDNDTDRIYSYIIGVKEDL